MRDQPKSFKALFYNFFEEPTREKLRELLRENLGEFAYCDFKATWIEPSKLSRHILAMANSGRGCLIFGVAENTDGTNDPIGLSALTDKKEIFEKIEKYIPPQLMNSIDILDFSYDASEYPKLVGKKFQVLFVDDNPEHLLVS